MQVGYSEICLAGESHEGDEQVYAYHQQQQLWPHIFYSHDALSLEVYIGSAVPAIESSVSKAPQSA